MKLFKKLAVQVHARAEAMANQFENKEALSLSYIREYERVVAEAKVKLARVAAEVRRLEREAERLEAGAALWVERARRVHAADEGKALACVKRMQQEQAACTQVLGELEKTRRLKRKMAHDVEGLIAKLSDLRGRYRCLSGRESCARAAAALASDGDCFAESVDDLFTRWEADVTARELHAAPGEFEADPLSEAFASEERQAALRESLAEILSSPPEKREVSHE
jgi:phage shock protein A